MRTTINLRDDLMEALMARTKAKSKTKAIEQAIQDYVDKQSIEDLISLSGKIRLDLDWEEEERLELDEHGNHR